MLFCFINARVYIVMDVIDYTDETNRKLNDTNNYKQLKIESEKT